MKGRDQIQGKWRLETFVITCRTFNSVYVVQSEFNSENCEPYGTETCDVVKFVINFEWDLLLTEYLIVFIFVYLNYNV
jgi:hypothetical protein